jgi:hypothetical protein
MLRQSIPKADNQRTEKAQVYVLTGGISVTEWQSPQYDHGQQQQRGAAMPGQTWQQPQSYGQPQYGQQQYGQPQYPQVQTYKPQQPVASAKVQRRTGLTGAQQFWYVLQCIAFGAGYFAKIPAKKALADFGMAELTSAEQFWYVLQCIAFGAGYFAKVPTAKALSEMPEFQAAGY